MSAVLKAFLVGLVLVAAAFAFQFVFALWMGAVQNAHAHHGADWISRGGYQTQSGSSCCSETDCDRLPDEAVSYDGQGNFIVRRSYAGQDVWVFPEHLTQFPKAEVRAEAGANWWACFWGGKLQCLFRPSFGG